VIRIARGAIAQRVEPDGARGEGTGAN
jgi:hypothetical protein